jgi:hypothetical protein
MTRKKEILDSLWLLKGSWMDAEYFSYVLLAAAQKYKKDLEEGNLSYFYEVLFHSLNLNTLAVEGNLFDFKMNPIWKDDRISKIKEDLKKIYEDTSSETVEIFRNANFVFLSLLIDYMESQSYFLENMEIFFVNPKIHQQKEIFIITNCINTKKYVIWKLSFDRKKEFGFSFKRLKSLKLDLSNESTLKDEIAKQNISSLTGMKEKENVVFAILHHKEEEAAATVIKDLIVLNTAISKEFALDPNLIMEIQGLLIAERVMPFNLNQWI